MKLSKKHRERISESMKGNTNCVGRSLSKKTKRKIGKARKKYFENTKNREFMRTVHLGTRFDKKHKEKISDGMKEYYSKYGSRKGKESHNWKGGVTSENLIIRTSSKYELWRKTVFERDNYTCQKYKIRGRKLIAHHIKNFAQWPELRFEINNGSTLSDKAHREFHRKYGIKSNNDIQLNEYLI